MEEIGELRALANPTRLRLLSLLAVGPLTAAEASRRLGIAHGSASFHLRQLAAAGVIRLVDGETRPGGQERRYTYDPAVVPRLAPAGKGALETAVVQELRRRLTLPRGKGPEMITNAEVWVPAADWEAALLEVEATLKRLVDKAAPAAAPGLVRGSLSALLFLLASDEPGAAG